jgi:hypothetical protein
LYSLFQRSSVFFTDDRPGNSDLDRQNAYDIGKITMKFYSSI